MISNDTPFLPDNQTELEPEELEDGDTSEAAPIEIQMTPEVCGMRLDKALAGFLPRYSRSRLQQWIEAGLVTVDGAAARAKATVLGDELIRVSPQPAPEQQAYAPEAMPLDIVFEDESLIVINKPVGLVVHPAAGNWSGTLLNGLLHHAPSLAGVPRAGIVHRLDKDTSGLMVVAKTLEAQTDLVRQLQARSVRREYLALVWGSPHITGRVEAAIARHSRDRIRMAVSQHESAKPAVTHYQRLAAGTLAKQVVSLMRCQLETGRTHQIRVHMQSIGFPLVGDTLYGKVHLAAVFGHQALHAFRLGLVHPQTRKDCKWEAALPADLLSLLAQAGIDGDIKF